ncbi:hypothetical protein ACFLYD_07615 [Chloroflexota bacterium]
MTEEQRSDSGLLDELQSLGQQLTTAVKALWDSEDSRKLRQEIGEGFVELGQQMDSAVKTAQESDAAKQFGEQIKETVDKARESDVADKLEEGLVTGLREFNLGLSKLVTSLERSASGEGEPEVEAESEPVDEAGA